MDIKMETSCNNDVEIVLTPKNTPKYNVGQIIIHSDQEDEVEGGKRLVKPIPGRTTSKISKLYKQQRNRRADQQ